MIKWLRMISATCTANRVAWFIQGSLATVVHGVRDRNVTDVDVRVDRPVREFVRLLPESIRDRVRIRGHATYSKGEFRNECIILEVTELETHIDVTHEINTYRNDCDMVFSLPFDRTAALAAIVPGFRDQFPVCSLEYHIIYKLINSRDQSERKDDLGEASTLLGALGKKWEAYQE